VLRIGQLLERDSVGLVMGCHAGMRRQVSQLCSGRATVIEQPCYLGLLLQRLRWAPPCVATTLEYGADAAQILDRRHPWRSCSRKRSERPYPHW